MASVIPSTGTTKQRVVESNKADGIDRRQYAYADGKTVRTNAYGKETTYDIQSGRIVGIAGHASPNCPATFSARTFDANGRLDTATDALGVKTRHTYDTTGWLVAQTEASGTPLQRRTLFERDATGRLLRTTLEGSHETRYLYSSIGLPVSMTQSDLATSGTRTTQFAYTRHANGMLASVTTDGPLPGDTVIHTYGATGNLLQVRNEAGHATSYVGHNPLGQPTRVTSPTGAVTEYEYDARGRVVVERTFPSGTPVETRYVYGASGLLDATQTADGNTVVYHYDTARRLVQEDVTEPGGSFAVRRTTWNAMSQPIKVEIGRDL